MERASSVVSNRIPQSPDGVSRSADAGTGQPIVATIPETQPTQRRTGRKSMRRRSGQNGTIVTQSGWYRVCWRMDVEGQTERMNMSEKIAPVVFDKNGNPKPASPEVRRKARGIVEQSGANSKQHFNQVVLGDVTFSRAGEGISALGPDPGQRVDQGHFQHRSGLEYVDPPRTRRYVTREHQQHHRQAVGGENEEVTIGTIGE